MSFEYINLAYGIHAKRGGRVEYTGNSFPMRGTIKSADGANLIILLDGEMHARRYHPTWQLKYLEDSK